MRRFQRSVFEIILICRLPCESWRLAESAFWSLESFLGTTCEFSFCSFRRPRGDWIMHVSCAAVGSPLLFCCEKISSTMQKPGRFCADYTSGKRCRLVQHPSLCPRSRRHSQMWSHLCLQSLSTSGLTRATAS